MSSLSSEQYTFPVTLEDYAYGLRIDYQEIKSAINNFADENLISKNTFYKTYKGQLLHSGELIDVVARQCLQMDVMRNEMMMSKDLKHKNIVPIFKVDDMMGEPFIINKHEANGSLIKHLSGSNLTWIQRLHICVCVSDALRYIHNIEDDECVIHGNINSSNILLDHNWEPKLKGFRFAIRAKKHHRHLTSIYKGSIQYMDPECETIGGLTHKSDVFSFGVVLFEVLFGRNAEGENWYFARLARSHYEAGTLGVMINSDLRKQMNEDSLKIFSDTAYVCLKEGGALRPDMDHIFKKLQKALELQQMHESYVRSSNRLKGKNMDHLRIPLSDIESATNKFSTNCIGSGGFGTVYKAELDIFDDTFSSVPQRKNKVDFPKKRTTVAVKRLKRNQGEVAGFFTEIEMLTNCKHPNIVSLLGFCEEGPERILVYEHVPNGSLSDYFEKINNTQRLSWAQRLQICLDIAHGLDYLHSNTKDKPMIVHRDIKSDNILLDNSWVAKIADFGLSRLRPANQIANTINTCTIAGTEVYLDPEYMETGKLRKEIDIYSFGVVLFEVVSGKLAYDRSYSIENEKGLLSIVHKCFNEKTLNKVIDPNLKETCEGILILDDRLDQKCLDTFFDIAYQCLAHTQARRPTMKDIVNELGKALSYQENRKDGFHISLKDITLATNNFSHDKCIGEGRYWKQYEAQIPLANRRTTVIVKRWDKNSGQARQQFLNELNFLHEKKHKHIVALVGVCNESGERITLYEHGSNGSLNKHLGDASFTWIRRLKICVGIASALEFLYADHRMIHRDIKSSSILLDADWEPKICNFELSSKSYENLKVEHATDNAYGTLGYLDPVHEEQGYLDERSDVYSLGVILMEILCGRLAWGAGCKDHSQSLGPLAKRQYKEGSLYLSVFEGIKEHIFPQSFANCEGIAAQCFENPAYRPRANEVEIQLKKALRLQEFYDMHQISLEDIKVGTQNFSDSKCIVERRYWKQYKGEISLADGLTTVVVKRFDTKCDEGSRQCIRELEALFDYEHENVIRLAGYCDKMNEKIIIYKYASNGRLNEHLKDTSLTWLKRLKICIDVATGLKCLTKGYDKIIHGNIKSGSILIDGEWRAIISNLELLRDEGVEKTLATYAYDSFGYIDPDCEGKDCITGFDIYALGVVLLEILCGRLAWEGGCKDPSECLGPLAKRRHKEGTLDELVFDGIRKQIHKRSLTKFTDIAIWCLDYDQWQRPNTTYVILYLQMALEYQEDYETWEPKLPRDYEDILHFSKIDKMEKFKDMYETLRRGFHLRDREVFFSLGINGAKNYVISAAKFTYKSRWAQSWQRIPQSRFRKVAKMLTSSNLNIHIKMKTPRLSLDANYAVNLVFKFCGKPSAKSSYVNVTYKIGSQTFHAYFALSRDEDWMNIELCRFLNHKEGRNFELILESFSRTYCGSNAIYVEGIEFQSIDNVKQEGIDEIMDVQKQLPTNTDNRSENNDKGGKLFPLNEVSEKKHFRLSAIDVLYDSSKVKPFHLNPSAEKRFQEGIELLPQQVFGIKCRIESQMLLPNTDYMCYLVFKLSEKCHGLNCPVRVRDVLQWKNKKIELLCFRPPSAWDLLVTNRVPNMREDGWMEVMVWKFNSTSELRNNGIPMHLKLITYEGTMSGLIVRGLELRPM